MSELRLRTELVGRGPAAAIILSDDQVATLSAGKAFPVVVTIGTHTARLRVARMGGENLIGFTKAVRGDLGLEVGQTVDAVIRVDAAERTVDVPPALADALDADPALRAAFDALSYSARKEHARTVADAKQDATRERRIAKIVDALRG